MKTIIKATAPTVYQLRSLNAFHLNVKENRSGSFSGSKEFDSKEEAKDFLRERAEKYNDSDPCGDDESLQYMFECIEKGHLTLDAVTASIEEIEEEDSEE